MKLLLLLLALAPRAIAAQADEPVGYDRAEVDALRQACVALRFCNRPDDVKSIRFGALAGRKLALVTLEGRLYGGSRDICMERFLFARPERGDWAHFTETVFGNGELEVAPAKLEESFEEDWPRVLAMLVLGPGLGNFTPGPDCELVRDGSETASARLRGTRSPGPFYGNDIPVAVDVTIRSGGMVAIRIESRLPEQRLGEHFPRIRFKERKKAIRVFFQGSPWERSMRRQFGFARAPEEGVVWDLESWQVLADFQEGSLVSVRRACGRWVDSFLALWTREGDHAVLSDAESAVRLAWGLGLRSQEAWRPILADGVVPLVFTRRAGRLRLGDSETELLDTGARRYRATGTVGETARKATVSLELREEEGEFLLVVELASAKHGADH